MLDDITLDVAPGEFVTLLGAYSSMSQVFLANFLVQLADIAIDLLIFSPRERRVLRSRGLLVTR